MIETIAKSIRRKLRRNCVSLYDYKFGR